MFPGQEREQTLEVPSMKSREWKLTWAAPKEGQKQNTIYTGIYTTLDKWCTIRNKLRNFIAAEAWWNLCHWLKFGYRIDCSIFPHSHYILHFKIYLHQDGNIFRQAWSKQVLISVFKDMLLKGSDQFLTVPYHTLSCLRIVRANWYRLICGVISFSHRRSSIFLIISFQYVQVK